MPSQSRDSQKDILYSQFYEHKKMPSADEQRVAYELGKDYLRRYGGDERDADVKSVRKFVSEYEKVHGRSQLDAAVRAKKYSDVFQIGRALLKSDPEDFYVLGTLVSSGYEAATAGGLTSNHEIVEYDRSAIKLLESGKITTADPFRTPEIARGFLNFVLGWFLRDESPVEAAGAFRKAAQTDSPYKSDSQVYYRMGLAIVKGELSQASIEYNEKFGNKPPSAEQNTAFLRIQTLANLAIDAFARAVALSDTPQQSEAHAKILNQLTVLYKSFHNNSDAGLAELIAGVLAKPLP